LYADTSSEQDPLFAIIISKLLLEYEASLKISTPSVYELADTSSEPRSLKLEAFFCNLSKEIQKVSPETQKVAG
jgi:hypothetical protein